MIRPISGGAWKQLVGVSKMNGLLIGTFDRKWVLYCDADSMGRGGLFRVPISGGQPKRLGDLPTD